MLAVLLFLHVATAHHALALTVNFDADARNVALEIAVAGPVAESSEVPLGGDDVQVAHDFRDLPEGRYYIRVTLLQRRPDGTIVRAATRETLLFVT